MASDSEDDEKIRNPFCLSDDTPKLRPSVFALIDILGYKEMTLLASQQGRQQDLLRKLHSALSSGRTWLEDRIPDLAKLDKLLDKDLFVLKAFTDNIVIAAPIRRDAEVELGMIVSKLSDFQFSMSLEGFFVRGAVSIGDAYVDQIAVFGDALIEAYEGETKLARDPRIVLTDSAVSAVKVHLGYYGDQRHAPQTKAILCGSDGQWFVNYLNTVLYVADDYGPFYDEFAKHKAAVEDKLAEHKNNPNIFSKYAWVAGYHNFFCDLHFQYFSDEHKINTDLFRALPRLIAN